MKSTKFKSMKQLLLVGTLLLSLVMPGTAWADGEVTIKQTSSEVYVVGTESQYDLVIRVKNATANKITGIQGNIDGSRLSEKPFNTVATLNSIDAGSEGKLSFPLNGVGIKLNSEYTIPVTVTYNGDKKLTLDAKVKGIEKPNEAVDIQFRIAQLKAQRDALTKEGKANSPEAATLDNMIRSLETASKEAKQAGTAPAYSRVNAPRMTITPNFSPIIPGQVNMLPVTVTNTGDSVFNSVSITMGALPEGFTLKDTSTMQQVASITPGGNQTVIFPVEVKKGYKAGNYPITFTAKGTHISNTSKEEGKTLQEYSIDQSFYLSVGGDGATKKRSGLNIENIQAPPSAVPGKEFILTFSVSNTGAAEAKDFKVMAEGAETVVNKSKNIFIENSLPQGQKKDYKITFLALSSTTSKYYPIKITVEPLTTAPVGDSKDTATTSGDSNQVPIIQYTGVYVQGKEENPDGVKAPQVMVTKYTYGGKNVEAGKNFELHFTLKNVSDKPLRSIKASLTSDEGTFVPFNSSNSIFIHSLAPGASSNQEITFSTKPDVPQKTVGITVDTAYEDVKGNPVTAKDIISIPVRQKTMLSVDNVMSNPGAMVGVPTSVNVQFYNLGKTILSNLKVKGEGDFDVQGNVSYFAGNMDPGKSDSYEFSFTPRKSGEQAGKITFSYEDASGEARTLEKDFTVEVAEAQQASTENPEDEIPPEGQGGFNKLFLIPGIGIPALLLGGYLFYRHRKKKKAEALEISED